MEASSKTARQLFSDIKANPTRKRFGFGKMPALINIDLQKAYTNVGEFATAYETDPRQLEYVNTLAAEFRAKGFPVVWTRAKTAASGARVPTRRIRCKTSRSAVAAPSLTTGL